MDQRSVHPMFSIISKLLKQWHTDILKESKIRINIQFEQNPNKIWIVKNSV